VICLNAKARHTAREPLAELAEKYGEKIAL
jgi:hypothetical protein